MAVLSRLLLSKLPGNTTVAILYVLTKREVQGLNAAIEEFDLEGSVYDWTFLPDELIESGLSNFAGAVRRSVNSAIFAGSAAIQSCDKANRFTVLS